MKEDEIFEANLDYIAVEVILDCLDSASKKKKIEVLQLGSLVLKSACSSGSLSSPPEPCQAASRFIKTETQHGGVHINPSTLDTRSRKIIVSSGLAWTAQCVSG